MSKRIRIGELLQSKGLLTGEQVEEALATQKRTGRKLGRTLVELGHVSEDVLIELLCTQLRIPKIDLRSHALDAEVVKQLPETHARRFRAIPIEENESGYLVAMSDPTDIVAMDELTRQLGRVVRPAGVTETQLLAALDAIYRQSEKVQKLAVALDEELSDHDVDLATLSREVDETDAPVVRLLQHLFEQAIHLGASDIHIEPDDKLLRIRQRIDGVLHEEVMKETRVGPALVLRLKLMAQLDISEKRLPQDGRFQLRVDGRSIDVRLSTMPIQHGESVVLRILDQGQTFGLADIGMPEATLARFRELIHRPHGMVLVTGPTGSGKTTTLYAALRELNHPGTKIITVEDPVEYRLPRVAQVQVRPKIDLTFGRVLRAALRQDPDVLMVGEIRDQETAEIALRAAMTGHLVLATLHTNDAVATAPRLIDMGAEGYLVATSLLGIVAQRLVRRICEECSEPAPLDVHEKAAVTKLAGPKWAEQTFSRGRGCTRCNETGYRGRVGVYEMLVVDEPMADALRREDVAAYTRAALRAEGYRRLVHTALLLARRSETSIDEVLRVASGADAGPGATEVEASPAPVSGD